MNQPIPNSPQEAWLQVLGKSLVTFPERWWDELGMQSQGPDPVNGMARL